MTESIAETRRFALDALRTAIEIARLQVGIARYDADFKLGVIARELSKQVEEIAALDESVSAAQAKTAAEPPVDLLESEIRWPMYGDPIPLRADVAIKVDTPEWRAEQVWKAVPAIISALPDDEDVDDARYDRINTAVARAECEFDALLARQRAKFVAPTEG